jgi:hypothetical protein
MIIFERKQRGETKISVPTWAIVLVASMILILAIITLLVKYDSVIIQWLQ